MGNIASNDAQRQVHGQYMERFNDVYSKMQVQEDNIKMSSAPKSKFSMFGSAMPRAGASAPMQQQMAMRKAPARKKQVLKQRIDSADEESDAEDNAFGAAFNKEAAQPKSKKKSKGAKKKGSFLGGLFGGLSKSKAAASDEEMEDVEVME